MSFKLNGKIKKISSYGHTLILMEDGTVYSYGKNALGCLGWNDTLDHPYPEKIPNLSGVIDIGAGSEFSVFLMADRTVKICGRTSITGGSRLVPTIIEGISDVSAISVGGDHVLFLKPDGIVYGAGKNSTYQLGLGDTTTRETPVQLMVSNIANIYATDGSSYFISKTGIVYVCGSNGAGKFGLGDPKTRLNPVAIPNLTAVKVAASVFHTLYLRPDGTVWSCGDGTKGALGYKSALTAVPTKIPTLSGVKDVQCGGSCSMFLMDDNSLKICGTETNGELGGLGKITIPTDIGITNIEDLYIGRYATFIKLKDGSIIGAGFNGQYQLCTGDTVDIHKFITVFGAVSNIIGSGMVASGLLSMRSPR